MSTINMDAVASTRPWESITSSPMPSATQNGQPQLPSISAMTAGVTASGQEQSSSYALSSNAQERDSGNWSMPPSTLGSSAYSSGTNGYQHLPTLNSSPTSPSRFSASGRVNRSPYSNPGSSVVPSPRYAHENPGAKLHCLTQAYDAKVITDAAPQDSRRSSVDSRMNQGLHALALAPSSPYGSTNASQTSIVSGLQRERGIPGAGGNRNSRNSNPPPLSPLGPRSNSGEYRTGRVAPPISSNPRSDIYNAAHPTAGQPYAFPDPEFVPRSSGSGEEERNPSAQFSRRGSLATSVTSSIYTNDSRLPAGQRRLEDEMPGTHHHSLQHRQVSNLMGENEAANGNMPYSRTPELRVSHKIAERKRRSEMKDLFENLRQLLPSHQGAKSSKWEILTKASDYIRHLDENCRACRHENKQLRNEVHLLHKENDEMRNELTRMHHELQRQQQGPAYAAQPRYNGSISSHMAQDAHRPLPPIMNGAPAPTSMQGVQYSNEQQR